MSKLQERLNQQVEAYEKKTGRTVHYHEYVWAMLQLSGKETVPLASRTRAFKLSDVAYEVRYDNVPFITVDATKGITLHWRQDQGDGPFDDRMSRFFPEWDRPYGGGNYHRQKVLFVSFHSKAVRRNSVYVAGWVPVKARNGTWTVEYRNIKSLDSSYDPKTRVRTNNYGDITFTWAELKEFNDKLKLVK